jgi:DNA repair photolyase
MIYSTGMNRVEYIAAPCKSALNRVEGMPFRWSLNPYRGCVHGCHYCYARATHPYLGLNAGEEFSTRILVKHNMADVLRRELGRASWARERVALGTATDAYQPCEGRFQITRAILKALLDYRAPVSVVTKSTLVWRDRDLLAALAGLPGTRVQFTITTLDRGLWKRLEPGTPPPDKRLEIMRRLTEAGVPCAVYVAPVIPGLTDSEASLAAIAAAARDHGATALWAGPLRLAPLVKEHFFTFLGETMPELLPRYERTYPRAEAPPTYRAVLDARIGRILDRYGFERTGAKSKDEDRNADRAKPESASRGQLSLPL